MTRGFPQISLSYHKEDSRIKSNNIKSKNKLHQNKSKDYKIS